MIAEKYLKKFLFPASVFCVLILFLCSVNSPAQNGDTSPSKTPKTITPKILFNQIPTELGLSQNVIIASLQDSKGFLWFGTRDGLNRFDGYEFKVYRYDPDDPGSISNSRITALFEDSRGLMWVGTENGLNLFDRTQGRFYRMFPDPDDKNGLGHQSISSINEDKKGAIWIGNVGGLNKLELSEEDSENPLKGAKFTYFSNDFGGNSNDSSQPNKFTIKKILVDEGGIVWVKTFRDRIFTLMPDAANKKYVIKGFHIEGREAGEVFLEFCFGQNGKIWLVTKKGIFEWNKKTKQAEFYEYDFSILAGEIKHSANMIDDRKGNIWFSGYWGLSRFNPNSGKFDFFPAKNIAPPDVEVNSLLEYGVNSILESRSGALWFGTNGNGIVRYNRDAVRFAHFNEPDSKLSLWQGFSIRSLYETDDGILIVCGVSGLCWEIDRANGKTVPFVGLPGDLGIRTMIQDRNGSLWAGGVRSILKVALSGGITKKPKIYILETNELGGRFETRNNVARVFEDKDGNLWATTGSKIYLYDPQTDDFTGDQFDDWQLDHYGDIFEDANEKFWIGTVNGLILFDREKKTFKRFKNDPNNPKSLSNNGVRTIAQDPFDKNILWIGTAGGGLNRFDTKNETFTALTEKDGLSNNVVYGILDDEKGNLWMSTNKGISRFDPKARTFKNFDKKDGLQDDEFNSNAYFKSKKGELFFGGIGGFNVFNPADLKDNRKPPPVVITGFNILNKPVSAKTPDSPLTKAITETKEITLSYEQRFFSFEFASLDFNEPSKNKYAYQLEGFDKDLENIGNRRTAFYTNVTPGSYTFRVIASNNDGVWNRKGAKIKITILPPFWQTWWFRTLLILIGIGLVFLIVYPYLSKLRYEKEVREEFAGQLIEEQERDRKRIAGELHDELGQSLLIIKNRAFLGEKVTETESKSESKIESAREQFGEISESVSEALEQVRAISYYLRPSQLERLGLTSAIEEMIERVADSSDIKFEFELAELEDIFSKENEINFYRIVQESLNNIIKHSEASLATIKIKKVESRVELIIRDDGKGFVPEETRKNKRRSFGLKGMSERARLLGGTYSVKSSPGKGTVVRVVIKKVD